MDLHTLYRFLRPTLFVVACFAIAMVGSLYVAKTPSASPENDQLGALSATFSAIVKPSPDLQAIEVVQLQLDGLSSENQAEGILQCMTFASPENRIVTGPLERFGQMARGTQFIALANPDRVLIGKPTLVGKHARILVTLVKGKQLSSYLWVLSRQVSPPFEHCWMTDGVFPLDQSDARPANDTNSI